ncbi:unnamed protein product [Rotaria sordida]|uniref:Uncharacterized protein n=1 Tax=Rotaria sordida TaxID=392033 RepID=A0A816ET54_9BILA|nr:unnamed protein product [Rotaria sordida]CAF1650229.1 unnamed protein product [Rotaria sordida]
MEQTEASQSGDYLSFYTHPLASMKIPNFNLFDTMTAAGIYDSTISSLSNDTTRQYMVNQASSASASDTSSSPTKQALSYYTYESYSHMQKMSGNYPVSYEFYQ